jgi:hypothetical protein
MKGKVCMLYRRELKIKAGLRLTLKGSSGCTFTAVNKFWHKGIFNLNITSTLP